MKINEKRVTTKMRLAEAKAKNKLGAPSELEIMGSGPLNRDGVPEIPPEQKATVQWPILDLGVQPTIDLKEWALEVKGLCDRPQIFTFETLCQLQVIEDTSDFHCVTGWSKLGISWKGVRFSDIAKAVGVHDKAKFVYIEAYDTYTTNLSLAEAMKYDVLIVFEANGKALEKEHGGPLRMITPQLWAWKGAKWIKSIEFLKEDRRGFWEERGYSNSAIPWLNDRYTQDESNDDIA